MNKLSLVLISMFMVACASAPADHSGTASSASVEPSTAASSAADEVKNEPSQVLNKNKKCPKKSKMVNGKCLLQVESKRLNRSQSQNEAFSFWVSNFQAHVRKMIE